MTERKVVQSVAPLRHGQFVSGVSGRYSAFLQWLLGHFFKLGKAYLPYVEDW